MYGYVLNGHCRVAILGCSRACLCVILSRLGCWCLRVESRIVEQVWVLAIRWRDGIVCSECYLKEVDMLEALFCCLNRLTPVRNVVRAVAESRVLSWVKVFF